MHVEETQAQNIREIDRDILKAINGIESPILNGYSDVASASASIVSIGLPVTLFSLSLIEKDETMKYESIYIGGAVVTGFLSSYLLKDAFNRNRPYISHPNVITPDGLENSYSFPSSHTATSFSLATALSLQHRKWYIIAPSYFWAVSVGFSRMHKGVHYPSDVFAGALVGTCSAYLCYELNKWVHSSYINKKEKKTNTLWINDVYSLY